MVSIRYAGTADAELIADLSRATFYETFAPLNSPANMDKFMAEQFSHAKLATEVSDPANIFLLAFTDDAPVGYAKMREGEKYPEFKGRPSVEIARIYAATSSIGKGVGSALMQKCIDHAKDAKKDIIWLGVWEQNQRAIDFYTKWGFSKFDTHLFMLGDDPQTDWLMKKELS